MDLKALYKDPKSYIIGMILLWGGEKIWGYIEKGVDSDLSAAIKIETLKTMRSSEGVEIIDSIIDYKTVGKGSPIFLTSLFTSPFMIDYKKNEKKGLLTEAFHQDSTKAKLSTFLTLGTGMNDQAMRDSMVSMLNWYTKEKKYYIKKREVTPLIYPIIRKEVKPTALTRPVAVF